ncbi:MAG TPA: diguanylate cyclase [Erysipelotrichaceae bacterium]|nr:diguanylate cyclase [Erysipelotrichaceae bacterium]
MKTRRDFFKKYIERLIDDEYRKNVFLFFNSGSILLILLVSSLIRFFYGEYTYVIGVLCFCALFILIILLGIFLKKYRLIVRYSFIVCYSALCVFLLMVNGPRQVFIYWILLLPSFSFIFFGLIKGAIGSFIVAVAILIIYWTPVANYVFASNPEALQAILDVRLNFSLLYLVCTLFGAIAEIIRYLYARINKRVNEQLEYSLLHDSLTNVANQRYLIKYIGEMTKCNRCKGSFFGCFFIDIDDFKNVNDDYGHIFGNTVLCRVAEVLSRVSEAFVCRWGGDEFVVCFENVSKKQLRNYADYYSRAVEELTFSENPEFRTSISLGMNIIKVDESFNLDSVLDVADNEMRAEKRKTKKQKTTKQA